MAKHKSRYPKLLDEGIETDWKKGYQYILTGMSKMIISKINKFSKEKQND